MIVNEMKTKIMTFGNTKECKFMYNGKEIDSVSNYKYLGVLFKPVIRCDGNIFGDAYTVGPKFISLNKPVKPCLKSLRTPRRLA